MYDKINNKNNFLKERKRHLVLQNSITLLEKHLRFPHLILSTLPLLQTGTR